MKTIQQAQDLFHDNKFSEAYSILKDCLEDQSLSEDLKVEALELLIRVSQTLKKEPQSLDYFIQCSKIYSEQGDHDRAFKTYQKIENFISGYQYYVAWDIAFKAGQLESAEKHARSYIDFLLQKKNVTKCLSFLDEVSSKGLLKEDLIRLKEVSQIKKGDQEVIKKKFSDVLDKYLIGEIEDKNKSYEELEEYFEEVPNYWKRNSSLRELHLINSLNVISKDPLNWDLRKDFINLLFEHLLVEPHSNLAHLLLLRYSFLVRRKGLLTSSIEFITTNSDKFSDNQSIVELARKGEAKIEAFDEDEDDENEDLDMATDLFETVEGNAGQVQLIRKLERDISFLQKQGQNEEALNLMRELRSLDENNDLIKDLNEFESIQQGSSVLKKKVEIDAVEKELLRQISKYLPAGQEDDHEFNERNIAKTVEYLDREIVNNNYEDLVVSFITLGMPKAALRVLERADIDDLPIQDKINYLYLKAHIYIVDDKTHKAIDIITEILTEEPLLKDEMVCFLYMKAELLRKVGRLRDAISYYGRVRELNPHYRMVDERLREFE